MQDKTFADTFSKSSSPRGFAARPTISSLSIVSQPIVWLLLAILMATSACSEKEVVVEPEPRSVRSMEVGNATQTRARTFSGTSKASLQSRLSFKVGGTVVELPVRLGDRLQRGQLVARIDPFQYELEVERSEADLLRARAAERNATTTYERTKELYADNNASRGDLDTARANAESAQAQTRSAEKLLELSRLQASYAELRATEDCSVASVNVEVNENVGVGATVATVNCGESIEVEVSIPESLIGLLEEGMQASVRFDSLPKETFSGVVNEVGVAAESGATFPVSLLIDGQHPDLRAGLAAEVQFDFAQPGAVLTVPLSAVVQGVEGTYVYIAERTTGAVGKDSLAKVVRREVEIGELTAGGLEIVSGLRPGELLITAGLSSMAEGLDVRLGTISSNGSPNAPLSSATGEAGSALSSTSSMAEQG